MGSDEGRYFEDWLALELRHAIGHERGPRPRPAQARYAASRTGGSRLVAIRSGMLAALGPKAAAGGAAAALALGGGAVAAAHATGSNNPINWGQHVVQVVEGCKDVRPSPSATGSRGIGECVSDVAKTHGQQERAQHGDQEKDEGTPTSPRPGEREGQESPKPGNAGGAGDDHGRSNPHASPTPSPSPTGHGQGDRGGRGQPSPNS